MAENGENLYSAETQPQTMKIEELVEADDYLKGDEEEEDSETWGRFLPLSSFFNRFNFVAPETSFGLDNDCDYRLGPSSQHQDSRDPSGPVDRFLKLYSRNHFRVLKEDGVVFVRDESANGTFVNGEKIGKGKKTVIDSGAEIALAIANNRAFIFMDKSKCSNRPEFALPVEFSSKFVLSKVLGRGACGEVRLCFAKSSDQRFAVKIIEKKSFSVQNELQQEWNIREVEILRALDHPNVIRIFSVFETPERVFLLLEYVDGGELFDWIVKGLANRKGVDRCSAVKSVFAQMVLAVKYLHDSGITHRDLKPENVLLTGEPSNFIVKITDFGLSKMLTEQSLLKTVCGTPNYVAPEIINLSVGTAGTGSYTKAVDCWSLGVILFLMLVGYPPFSSDYKDLPLGEQIRRGRYMMVEKEWRDVDPDAKDLMTCLLKVSPSERLTVDGVLAHTWLQDEETMEKLSSLLPNLSWPVKDKDTYTNGKRKSDQMTDFQTDIPEMGTPKKSKMSVDNA